MYHFVYETTNTVNCKRYRGVHSSTVLDDNYLGTNKALQQAIRKYGRTNFERLILEVFTTREEAFLAERRYVDTTWVSRVDTYNFRCGGGGKLEQTFGRSMKHTEETKQKIASHFIGKSLSPEHKDAIHRGMLGKNIGNKLTDAHKQKLSENAYWLGKITPIAKQITYNGRLFASQRKLAEYLGITAGAISNRIARGTLSTTNS